MTRPSGHLDARSSRPPSAHLTRIAPAVGSATGSAFDRLASLLKTRSGLIVTPDKLYLLETRLAPILERESLPGLDALADRLPRDDSLAQAVVEAMTTNETLFFRDGKPFADLRLHALPALHRTRPSDQPLRLWSAAASTGQEAYSLAMLIEECRPFLGTRPVQIVGTDIARDQLARARDGVYSQFEVQRGLSMKHLVRHFRREEQGWRVSDDLRAMCQFREWNLLSDLRPLGRFDVIFCRNVLIYFDLATKARVLEAAARQLAPDGYLYLGGTETVLGLTVSLTQAGADRTVLMRSDHPAIGSATAEVPAGVPA